MNNIKMIELHTVCKRLLSTKSVVTATRNPGNKAQKLVKTSIKDIKYIPRLPVKQKISEKRPFRVSIEGNIGAGKTTVINYFSQYSGVEVYSEPINWWRNLEGHNLLDLLYKDINKWYNVFQKYVQLTRVQIQTMPPKYASTTTQIFERSIQNNRYTFVEQAFAAGYLKPPEYEVLNQWFDWIRDNIDIEVDFVVYLQTTPQTVYERMKDRGRLEETAVPFDYLKELHEFHEKWLITPGGLVNNDKLLIINADLPLDLVLKQFEENKNRVISKNLVKKSAENKMF